MAIATIARSIQAAAVACKKTLAKYLSSRYNFYILPIAVRNRNSSPSRKNTSQIRLAVSSDNALAYSVNILQSTACQLHITTNYKHILLVLLVTMTFKNMLLTEASFLVNWFHEVFTKITVKSWHHCNFKLYGYYQLKSVIIIKIINLQVS